MSACLDYKYREYTNSMAEEQANTEISMSTTENAEAEKEHTGSVLKLYFVSIVLIVIGFYFLVFAIIELVTNFYVHSYLIDFPCTDYQCSARLSASIFPNQGKTYIYLSNSKLTQNILEGFTKDHTTQFKNSETDKKLSVSNLPLNESEKSYPCGKVQMFYPENDFSVTDFDLNRTLKVKTDGISSTNFNFKNVDLAKQWADVETSRYSAWVQNSIALGLNKYWGYIEESIPKNVEIKLKSKNKLKDSFKEGLKIQFIDNMALGGYNLPLCAFNFIWAVSMFFFGCLSFWVISKNKKLLNSMEDIQGQTEEQQNQCQAIVDSTPTAHY